MSAFWSGFEKQAEQVGGRFMQQTRSWGVSGKGFLYKEAGAARVDRMLKALKNKRIDLPTVHRDVRKLDLKNQMRGLSPAEGVTAKALGEAAKP